MAADCLNHDHDLKRIVGWRSWHTGWRRFTSAEHEWVPEDGVLAVVLYENWTTKGGIRYRRIMQGSDWYWKAGEEYGQSPETHRERGQWVEPHAPPGALLRRGGWGTDEEMAWAQDEAMAAMELPR